jgi:hypothetical protein
MWLQNPLQTMAATPIVGSPMTEVDEDLEHVF